MILFFSFFLKSFTTNSMSSVLMKHSYILKLKHNLSEDISSTISAVFVVTSSDQNTNIADKYQHTCIQTNVLICCNSSHTVQRHNQVFSPSCQSQCSPKLFMVLYFIYDCIFPCHLKVRKSQFAGRNRAAKTFHRDRAAFISHTGWESCGMWGSYSADKPYHLYIASIMLRS